MKTKPESYLSLVFLVFIIIGWNTNGVESFTPRPRFQHSSVLSDSKLFILGGKYEDQGVSSEIFYIDLSESFKTSNIPWKSLSPIPVQSYCAAAATSGQDNSIIYLFGGIMIDPITSNPSFNSLIYAFDIKAETWSIPIIHRNQPSGRYGMSAATIKNAKIYIYGGVSDPLTGSNSTIYPREMNILDSIQSSWLLDASGSNSPSGRIYYSATMLSSGIIYYIGGLEQSTNSLNVTNINLTASGNGIQNRYAHTAVATTDNKIIIYGGATYPDGSGVAPVLAVLYISNFTWYAPSVTGMNSPPQLKYHTAGISGKYMILAYGNITDSNTLNPEVYIVDTNKYSFVTEFKTPGSGDEDIDVGKIFGIVIAVVTCLLIIVQVWYFGFHRRRRQSQEPELVRPHQSTQPRNDDIVTHQSIQLRNDDIVTHQSTQPRNDIIVPHQSTQPRNDIIVPHQSTQPRNDVIVPHQSTQSRNDVIVPHQSTQSRNDIIVPHQSTQPRNDVIVPHQSTQSRNDVRQTESQNLSTPRYHNSYPEEGSIQPIHPTQLQSYDYVGTYGGDVQGQHPSHYYQKSDPIIIRAQQNIRNNSIPLLAQAYYPRESFRADQETHSFSRTHNPVASSRLNDSLAGSSSQGDGRNTAHPYFDGHDIYLNEPNYRTNPHIYQS
ncbi:3803_t:CDS:2 [Acaulospora morrowiae]|uniref:3803_t:CDS:1 n=1 Tax=Acaulospora morrowiae TaxID=94023 RepID=A0A9N8VNW5_9GLOM|nr:3803_t:CDS:2 [Acaulospora morrowiae]